jgi:hypothetical protein
VASRAAAAPKAKAAVAVSPQPAPTYGYAPQPSAFWAGAGTLGVLLLTTISVIGGLLVCAILYLRPLFKVGPQGRRRGD